MQPDVIDTYVVSTLLPLLRRVHQRRRIGVFAGPPGIGKTTAVNRFAKENGSSVIIATVPPGPKRGVGNTSVIQLLLASLYDAAPTTYRSSTPNSFIELRNRLFGVLEIWARGDLDGRLTLVLDEAQNLSEDGIDALRYLNDANVGFSPFPVGLALIGNNRFRLDSTGRESSVLLDSVSDRALHVETFSYEDNSDADVIKFMERRGILDADAQRIVRRFFGARQDRSFRRLVDLLDELEQSADGAEITSEVVRATLGLT